LVRDPILPNFTLVAPNFPNFTYFLRNVACMPLSAAFGTTTQPVRLQYKFEAWNAWEWEDVMRMCVNQVIHHMSHHIMKLAKLGPTKSASSP
jgi:hypothetical protein